MPQVIGSIPAFTSDEGTVDVNPEDSTVVVPLEEEKETPAVPVTEEEPVGEAAPVVKTEVKPDKPYDEVTTNQIQGLQTERVKLLKEISELRGQKRELKEQELFKVQETIAELEGVNPDDVAIIEKVLRSKGYLTKEESSKMFYESVKQEELNKFLDKYPEYKPENDPNDVNWQTFSRELGTYFKLPANPHQIGEVLERVHKMIRPLQSAPRPDSSVVKRQLEVASVGSGGAQSSSHSSKSLSAHALEVYRAGGWSEEDIKQIEKNL